jgi:HSP20 family protein
MPADTEVRTDSQNQGQQTNAKRSALPASQSGQPQSRPGGGVARYAANPFGMLQRLSDEMDQLMEAVFYGTSSRRQGQQAGVASLWMPDVEVSEQGNQLRVRVDLPGVSKDDVRIEVQDRLLVIEGQRREERSEGDEQRGWRRTERRYGSFYRAIHLPEGADTDKADVHMKDGVLEVTVPLSEQRNARRLAIKE